MKKVLAMKKKINKWILKHNIYNRIIVKMIIAFLLHIDVNFITDLMVRNGCVIIFTNKYIYKIQIYGNHIKSDLNNRKKFPKQVIPLLVPIEICKMHPMIVRMLVLKQSNVNEEAANYILNELKKTGHQKKFKMSDYPLLVEGCKILKKCTYGEQANKNIERYLQKDTPIVRVGIVHGDFHRGNILYKGNRPVLIDFDCSRECDIQAIDALYYVLEEERHKHGYMESWLEEWKLLYENSQVVYEYKCSEQIDVNLKFGLVVLLLERLAQDQSMNDEFTERNKTVLRRINRLLSICG